MPGSQNNLLARGRQLLFEITCAEIQKLLADAKIPMLVLKGPHVGSVLYDNPAERNYCDLDVLVKPEHYYPAAKTLLNNGFTLFSMNQRRLAAEKADYQLLLRGPRGVAVELHRALADRDQFCSDVAGSFARSEEFSFGALEVRGLGAEDLLLHLCLHFGKRHFMTSESKHLLDIALLLKKRDLDWPAFLDRIRQTGCGVIAYYGLQAVVSQHGATVPNEVMAALRPTSRRRKILDKYLDPNVFPVYRFPDAVPGARERLVNLLLLDRVSRMLSSMLGFVLRSAMDLALRIGTVRKVWLKRHPLKEWVK